MLYQCATTSTTRYYKFKVFKMTKNTNKLAPLQH